MKILADKRPLEVIDIANSFGIIQLPWYIIIIMIIIGIFFWIIQK